MSYEGIGLKEGGIHDSSIGGNTQKYKSRDVFPLN